MSFLTTAFVLPLWQALILIGIPTVLLVLSLILHVMYFSVPECKTLFLSTFGNKYVLFNHSSYSTASLSLVTIDDMKLKGPKKIGTKIAPRHKDDVERVGRIKFIHTHRLSLYPVSSTTAYIVDKFINELRAQGVTLSDNVLDALFRCKLDVTKMIGYAEEEIEELVKVPVMKNGKQDTKALYDENGNLVGEEPLFTEVLQKKTVVYQAQLSEEEFKILRDLKTKLESTFVSIDTDGGDIFAWSHISDVVDIGMSSAPSDIEKLETVAEKRGAMKQSQNFKYFIPLAVGAFIFVIGAITFLSYIKG